MYIERLGGKRTARDVVALFLGEGDGGASLDVGTSIAITSIAWATYNPNCIRRPNWCFAKHIPSQSTVVFRQETC